MISLLDLHTKLKNARSSDGTTDSIGDIMLNWVGIKILFSQYMIVQIILQFPLFNWTKRQTTD